MALTYSAVKALADTYYESDTYEGDIERIFAFLVDVADAYVSMLEDLCTESPAPFLAGTTPIEATLNGLADNLDMKRDGTSPQYRD